MANTTPAPTYTLPTIRPNGTGAQSLVNEYYDFWEALNKAAEALQNASCNARVFQRAQQERSEAFRKMAELQAYAQAWMEATKAYL
jgi:hypothetical protein